MSKANTRINWTFMVLIGMAGAACGGVYEFAVNIIDNKAAEAATGFKDAQNVEHSIISPNIYLVKENELESLFNFATGQLISRTRVSENISFFNAMNRDKFVQSTLTEACALAAGAQEKLTNYKSLSFLPWEDNEITSARNTARVFVTRHCPVPTGKGPAP